MQGLLGDMATQWEPSAVAQVMRGAAERLDKVGWCQGTAVNEAKNECAAQAMTMVAVEMVAANPSLKSLGGRDCDHDNCHAICLGGDASGVFARFLGVDYTVKWNDAPGRTADEVTTNLRQCADQIDPLK